MLSPKIVAAALCGALSVGAAAASDTTECRPTAERFVAIVDVSGSMTRPRQTAQRPIGALEGFKRLAYLVTSKADENASAQSEVLTLAPFTRLLAAQTRSPEALRDELEQKLPERLETFGRPSLLGERAVRVLSENRGPAGIYVVTDARFDDAASAQSLKTALERLRSANPDRAVLLVDAAATREEHKAVDALGWPDEDRFALAQLLQDETTFERFYKRLSGEVCRTLEITGITFAFDRSQIEPAAHAALDAALSVLKRLPDKTPVRITGYTDTTGPQAYNERLGQRRADAVAAYFVEHGVARERLQTASGGESDRYGHLTREQRRRNRRVVLEFGELVSRDPLR